MKKYAYLLIISFAMLSNCKQKDPEPTRIVIDSTAINLGNIKSFSEIKSGSLVLDKTGDGSVSWTVSSDKSWLKLNKTSGVITKKDSLKFSVEASYLNIGDNTANITLIPTVDNVIKNAIKISVKINSSAVSVIEASGYALTKDETWSGFMQMKGNVTVPKGTTLTIKEGTRISISERARISVQGSIIIKGTPTKIVRLFAENSTSGQALWNGIAFFGEKLEMSYCAFSDMTNGVFIYSSSTSANTKFDHCLFSNGETAITDFSSNNNVLISFNTFLDLKYGYWQWGENKKVAIENCIFENNSQSSVYLSSNNSNDPKPTTISIVNTNFIKEGALGFIGISVPLNTAVLAENNFGLTGNYGLTSQKGNSITIKNSSNSTLKDIGCGFGVARSGRIGNFQNANSFEEGRRNAKIEEIKALERNRRGE
jgi:Right handed beta helix region/Viral BACON domain